MIVPPSKCKYTNVVDYRKKLTVALTSSRELAAEAIRKAQQKYKKNYDRGTTTTEYKAGEWILIRFPHEETGHLHKVSRPWHSPYHVMSTRGPDITAVKVYFPQDGPIQVHQTRVTQCPLEFPAGYYWYGGKRSGPGCPPKWVDKLIRSETQNDIDVQPNEANGCAEDSDDVHFCMEDTSLCGRSSSLTDCEDISPDPRRTKTPYGLRDHLAAPQQFCDQVGSTYL